MEPPPAIFFQARQREFEAVADERTGDDQDGIDRAVSETNVGEINTLLQIDLEHQVIADRFVTAVLAQYRPGTAGDVETEFGQRPAE